MTTPPPGVTADAVVWVLQQVVEPLAQALPKDSEVILHDLRKLPTSIVAIEGDVTHRGVGGAASDGLIQAAAARGLETTVGVRTRTPDGRELACTTIVVAPPGSDPVAVLCINVDQTAWTKALSILTDLMPTILETGAQPPTETFITDIDEYSSNIVAEAIAAVGVPVDLMKKVHKVAVVTALNHKGYFLLKESVETLAQALGVTRFTIYNYLNEITKP